MIERKPPRSPERSLSALELGAQRYPYFRKHILLDQPVSAEAVKAISTATGLGERQVRSYAARYKENPIPESLAPRPKGPFPGSHHMSDQTLEIIDKLAAEIFLQPTPPKVAEAARIIRGLLVADNGDYCLPDGEVSSERVIERIINDISLPARARTSMGSKSRSANEPHPGEYLSEGFLDLVQMDHTRGDVILVDSVYREQLGRPWLTLLIDIWTRCILGWYVSFGDPSIYRCGRAVANALLPKEPLLRHFGLELDYPVYGFFKRLHADQAKPHRAIAFRAACASYGIDPDVRDPGPAHHGGHIERLIGTMIGKMRILPGSTGSNVTERDGYDAEAAATMTLFEFERWLLCQIGIYHLHPHSALGGLCPAQLWEREVRRHGPLVPVALDPDTLFRRFLPIAPLTVLSSGINIKYRRYWHPKLKSRIGQKIDVAIDESTIQHVFALIDGGYQQLDIIGQYPDVSVAEWEAARKLVKLDGRTFQADGAKAQTARLIHEARKEVLASQARTKESRARRKRAEKEGVAHADIGKEPKAETEPPRWIAAAELGDDDWLRRP
jgi:putative transposase